VVWRGVAAADRFLATGFWRPVSGDRFLPTGFWARSAILGAFA
jgi:hypothetical protein